MKQHLPFLITAIIVAGIIGFSIMAKTSMEINAEAQARQEARELLVKKKTGLLTCLENAEERRRADWDDLCVRLGKGTDCLLHNTQANGIHQKKVSDSINCQKLWE